MIVDESFELSVYAVGDLSIFDENGEERVFGQGTCPCTASFSARTLLAVRVSSVGDNIFAM